MRDVLGVIQGMLKVENGDGCEKEGGDEVEWASLDCNDCV